MAGLLLAAIIIGTMGVLDDVAISQVSVVNELLEADRSMSTQKLFQATMRVGRDHTSAIVNTLVLAYLGASFPLVILLTSGQPPFDTFLNIINHEVIATEIVRTLIGSIGIIAIMPISSLIAISILKKQTSSS